MLENNGKIRQYHRRTQTLGKYRLKHLFIGIYALFLFVIALYFLFLFEARMGRVSGGSAFVETYFMHESVRLISGAIVAGCLICLLMGMKKRIDYLLIPAALIYIYACQVFGFQYRTFVGHEQPEGQNPPTIMSISWMGFFRMFWPSVMLPRIIFWMKLDATQTTSMRFLIGLGPNRVAS